MDTTITHRPMRFAAVIVVVAASLLMAASVPAQARSDEVTVLEGERWAWPFAPPFSVSKPYVQPAHAYASGHRGIDIPAAAGIAQLWIVPSSPSTMAEVWCPPSSPSSRLLLPATSSSAEGSSAISRSAVMLTWEHFT